MPPTMTPPHRVLRTPSEKAAASYWHHMQQARRTLLRRADDDLLHNHHGLGAFDPRLLASPWAEREGRLLSEMHRLEDNQSDRLLSLLGDVGPAERILDAGSGGGGTSFAAHQRFGCRIDGVNIARYQVDFANQIAARKDCEGRVKFHYQNMVQTEFPDGHFDRIFTNETTMYVDLDETFAEFVRVLKPGGTYVLLTWCRNDAVAPTCSQATVINANYVCHTHRRSEYFRALSESGLTPRIALDLTAEAIPYFELRRQMRTYGIEESADEAFLTGYQSKRLQYIAVVADRIQQ